MSRIATYDTTLRDGRQGAGISFGLLDMIAVAERLDMLGVDYIEAGWPGSNPKDVEFFEALSKKEFQHAKIVAFGSTRHAKNNVKNDPVLNALLASKAPVVTIFGKTWDLHVKEVFRITEQQNIDMIRESVAYLKEQGRSVIYDAEHFFDGYRANPEFAIKTLLAAQNAGAECLCLCETNGGMLPFDIMEIMAQVQKEISAPLGIHCHNDSGCGVANSLAAVKAGAVQVQGTINGYGERTGNANLCTIIPNLKFKMGHDVLKGDSIKELTEVSRFVSELANLPHNEALPYVGANAFAHKAGVHVNAVQKNSKTYEHIVPEVVGNHRRILISDYSGKSSVVAKAKEFNLDLADADHLPGKVVALVKDLENEGFQFEGAEASFELLLKQAMGQFEPGFVLKGFRIITHKVEDNESVNEATIKVVVNGQEEMAVAEGDGPVNALDKALRKVLEKFYPILKDMSLADYKVRILDGKEATAAKTRVLIESKFGDEVWGTVGVSENIIEASWQALVDSIEYLLLKKGDQ